MLVYSGFFFKYETYWQPPLLSVNRPVQVTTQKNLVCLNKQQDSMGGVVFPQC